MIRAARFAVGRLTCWTLEAGVQRLDGGAMFGVVPKPLWSRRAAADERNRITELRTQERTPLCEAAFTD